MSTRPINHVAPSSPHPVRRPLHAGPSHSTHMAFRGHHSCRRGHRVRRMALEVRAEPGCRPRTTCLLGKGPTWQGRAPGCSPRGGWAEALPSIGSGAGGQDNTQPVVPPTLQVTRHRAEAQPPTCREKASGPQEAASEVRLPPLHSLAPHTHRAGHGTAWQASRRLPGLLAGSHSSSCTGTLRAESTHRTRSPIRPRPQETEQGPATRVHTCPA